jgi:predicted metalloprotease
MRWRGRRESSNVEDRRGAGGGFRGGFGGGGSPIRIPIGRGGGGLSLSTIIILVVLFFALRACGIDPLAMLNEGGYDSGGGSISSSTGARPDDEMADFASVILAETEDVWNGIFKAQGETYEEPTMVLFSGQTRSGCGAASAAVGPFYCPNDHKVYLDLGFFSQLSRQFGASGDFARAYVIAHEVGHHVQNLIGILPKFNEMRQQVSEEEANRLSVRVELQADCFAGIWAHYTDQKGLLEAGDIDEALNAAHQIGDDTLQKRSQGYVVPDSFTHGTSEQRAKWFKAGYESGKLSACDTFNDQS